MKELSIEEKAKRYNELKVKASRIYNKENDVLIMHTLEDLFPELKESEDERIRKEIIAHYKETIDNICAEEVIPKEGKILVANMRKWIAWLEKQGEPTDINLSEFDLRLNKLLKQFETLPKEELANCLNFYLNVVQNDGTYKAEEKQGEQKPIDPDTLIQQRVDALADIVAEQKPTNKVEPKFHEGDWVVLSTSDGEKVVQIDSIEYFKSGEPRYITSEGRWFGNGTKAHLWTIQDAKDGDVLVASDGSIFLFKGTIDCACKHYVALTTDNVVKFNKGLEHFWETSRAVYPATKEQRDKLEKAMADAGYTFDFEKKELKKIAVPIFKIGDTIIKKHNSDILYFGSFTITDITSGKYWYNDRIICDITEQDEWELYETVRQNTAKWSEEDYAMLISIENILIGRGHSFHDKEINWLKSLRPQSQWQPSNGQMVALDGICSYIRNKADWEISQDMVSDLYKLSEQLKKLREE